MPTYAEVASKPAKIADSVRIEPSEDAKTVAPTPPMPPKRKRKQPVQRTYPVFVSIHRMKAV